MIYRSMRTTLNPRWLAPFGLSVFCVLAPVRLAAQEAASIAFPAQGYEWTTDEETTLKSLAAKMKSDPETVASIEDRSAARKKGSLPYLIEAIRVERIFRALTVDGIEPARIRFTPQAKSTSSPQTVLISLEPGQAPAMPALPTAGAESNGAAGEFTLLFASASAEPEGFQDPDLRAFLGSVGQENRDAIAIEGYTDSVGNAVYNQALGELRALKVFELLVRSGLPPYRIETKSIASSSGPGQGKADAAERKVVIHWTRNPKIAAQAQALAPVAAAPAAEPAADAQTEAPAAPAPTEAPAPAETPSYPAAKESTLDLLIFGGALVPGGELRDHAKTGSVFGLGIGTSLFREDGSDVRANLLITGKSTLEAKEAELSGPVTLHSYNLRFDYVFGRGAARPFVGLGVGVFDWEGAIVQKASAARHTGGKNDVGSLVTLGLDVALSDALILAPEWSWHAIGGDFSETLYSGVLSLRWRL